MLKVTTMGGQLDSQPNLLVILPIAVLQLFIIIAITVPLAGALVRYRANYSPKAVQLSAEEESVHNRTGPVIGGYFAMLKRVYRMEGWAGLYKGTMPVAFVGVFFSLVAVVHMMIYGRGVTDVGPLVLFAFSIASMLISLPFSILTYRAMTTPYKLPYFGLRQSLRVLLTPAERARPWILYLTPGLLITNLLITALSSLVLTPLQRLLLPQIPRTRDDIDNIFILRASIYFILLVLGTSVLVPLQVMMMRLALQRNHERPEGVVSAREHLAVYAPEEDVIGLRDEADPYLSLVDCAKRMVAEEGYGTMFRAWWITFIPLLMAGIAVAGTKPGIALAVE
ncbi:hypothetical protein D9615_003440 [Tricholomella constricta]|uniref:Mitochondrial carrier n=1 Tax=Tricholomella constricta TaxID=117010 RepID=A0A8H5HJ70_9AGAR|nr:hypothetical protein D9615_003440 [Tricholomella constricta]